MSTANQILNSQAFKSGEWFTSNDIAVEIGCKARSAARPIGHLYQSGVLERRAVPNQDALEHRRKPYQAATATPRHMAWRKLTNAQVGAEVCHAWL